jgi:hypothetical protein
MGVETMNTETKLKDNKPNGPSKPIKPGMKVKSRVKAGSVPDSPERWKSYLEIVARGL